MPDEIVPALAYADGHWASKPRHVYMYTYVYTHIIDHISYIIYIYIYMHICVQVCTGISLALADLKDAAAALHVHHDALGDVSAGGL